MGKRRGHGEGSIYQREDGHWCASVDLGYSSGKRRRKVIYGRTRKEVADKLKLLYRDQAAGANLAAPQQTVKTFLEYWLEHTVKRKNRVRTYDRYKADADNYLIPALGNIQLAKLTPDHVQELLNALYDRGLAYRTIRNVRAALRAALTQAVRKRYLTWNVAKLVDIPGEVTFIAQPLTEEQVRLFLTIIQGHRLEALYHIALGLGLRKGEILGLRWEDVDLDRAVICITGALQRQNGRLERSATKTEASVRVLALPPNQVASLRRHQARQNAECAAVPRWRASGMVFTSTIGTPLAPETLSQHFKAALDAAELPIIRFHDLRHTCATLMLKRGVSPRLIQEVLGHSQITTTMNTYTHVLEEVQREAVAVLDALFTPPISANSATNSANVAEFDGASASTDVADAA